MNDLPAHFWQATSEELKRGHTFSPETGEHLCLLCGERFPAGVIWPDEGTMYESWRFVDIHIRKKHGSVFEWLLNLDKSLTGLTDLQKQLVRLFHAGTDDRDVAKATGAGSTSTIRNHRFSLRERQKQAKVFAAVIDLMEAGVPEKRRFIPIPGSARQVDERFVITAEEHERLIADLFPHGPDGPLKNFPPREKKRVAVLRHLLRHFDPRRIYTEKEVTEILKPIYADYVTLRRLFIDYGFLARKTDGSAYWVQP